MKHKSVWIGSFVLVISLLFVLSIRAAEAPVSQGGPQDSIASLQYEQLVRDTLTALSTAYQQKDLRGFMKWVSPDFAGDDFLLYRAVRKDFRFFDNIDLRLAVDGIAINSKGQAQVTVKYNRSVIANKNSRSYKDSGLTQLTFHMEAGRAMLYDMRYPTIFGLSEGLLVTSGIVRTAETTTVLLVDRRGNVYILPFNEALAAANSNSVVSGIVSLKAGPGSNFETWTFADNRKSLETTTDIRGDFTITTLLKLKSSTGWIKLTRSTDFGSVTQAPDSGYSTGTPPDPVSNGDVYVLKLYPSNKFAVIEIRDWYPTSMVGGSWTSVVRYKYQPSGSRSFY